MVILIDVSWTSARLLCQTDLNEDKFDEPGFRTTVVSGQEMYKMGKALGVYAEQFHIEKQVRCSNTFRVLFVH